MPVDREFLSRWPADEKGQVLDVTPFLTFPPTTLSKQPSGKGVRSRMSDITQQLTGSTKGGKR